MKTNNPRPAEASAYTAGAELLAELLDLASGRPRRMARMSRPGETKRDRKTSAIVPRDKYEDLPRSAPLTPPMLAAHMAGDATYTATLDRDSWARSGAVDLDSGGRQAIEALLAAAARRGLAAFGVLQHSEKHSGGHVWLLYAEPAPAADIAAQLRQLLAEAGQPVDSELWPDPAYAGQPGIRLLFGKHQTNGTRGQLLTQAGELLDLDDPAELASAVELVISSLRNAAPPKAAPAAPATLELPSRQGSINLPYTNLGEAARSTAGEQAAERLTGAERIARARQLFNQDHNLAELLATYGAAPAPGGYSCPCGQPHTHETTLYIGRGGRLFSYSPRCNWNNGRYGLDPFGLFCKVEHADSAAAAANAVLGPLQIAPAQRPAPQDTRSEAERDQAQQAAEQLAGSWPAERQHQAAEAARKRAQRQRQAEQRNTAIAERAEADRDMPAQARKVLATHIKLAGQAGRHTWSIAAIAERAQLGERHAQLGNAYLIEHGYISRQARGPKQTAIWTLCAEPVERIRKPQAAIAGVISAPAAEPAGSPVINLIACEGGAVDLAELAAEARRLAWQVNDPERHTLDLDSMSAGELIDLAEYYRQLLGLGLDLAEPVELVDLTAEPGGPSQALQAPELASTVKQRPESVELPAAPRAAAPERRRRQRKAEPVEVDGGASYNPAADFTARPERPERKRKPKPSAKEQRMRAEIKRAQRWRGMPLGELYGERKKLENSCRSARFTAAQRGMFVEQLAHLGQIIASKLAEAEQQQIAVLGSTVADLQAEAAAPELLDLAPAQLALLDLWEVTPYATARGSYPLAARNLGGTRIRAV